MPFKFCKKCLDMRQFLPNGYDDLPRHCDVCGAEESLSMEGFLDTMADYASKWGIDLDRYNERKISRLEDNMDLSLWGMEDTTDDIVSDEAMEWGNWTEDPEPMTPEEEAEYLMSMGIDEQTLKDMKHLGVMKLGEAERWEAKCPSCGKNKRDHRYRCSNCGAMGWG